MKDLIRKILREYNSNIKEQRKVWTYDEVKDVAEKYTTLKDFREKENSAFQWAKRNKVLNDVTSHMSKRKNWTKDEIIKIATNYNKIKDFMDEHPNEYSAARRNGWLNDVTAHMIRQKESWTLEKVLDLAKKVNNMEEFRNTFPNAYDTSRRYDGWKEEVWKLYEPQQISWTYELAKSISDKYDDLTDFQKNEPKAIAAIRRLGWLDLLSHMNKSKRTWSDDEIRQEAQKYDNVKDFRENSTQAYYAAQSHNIYDEVTTHMKRAYTDWTKDMVWEEALKYKTRSDFMNGNYAAYQAAHNKGWYDDVTSHMIRVGNLYKRLVYVYEFSDNSVYVGLTYDKEDRDRRHKQKEKSAVFQHIKKTGIQPEMKLISDDYIAAEDAQNLEACTIEDYRNKGWTILNKAKAGGLGGFCGKRWTKDEIQKLALKYTSPTQFKSKHSSAFKFAERNGFLDDILSHMVNKKRRYTDDDIYNEMSNYKSGTELRKQNEPLWSAAYRKFGSDFIKNFYNK